MKSNKQFWEKGKDENEKDYTLEIKDLVMSALEHHKSNVATKITPCLLD